MNKTVNRSRKTCRSGSTAAYARVSCDKDAMLPSIDAQVHYYRNLICGNPDWQFAGIYADEANTGTKESREQFQQLLSECRAGDINMVIEEAILVRRIYSEFLAGKTPYDIAKRLTEEGVPTPMVKRSGTPPLLRAF